MTERVLVTGGSVAGPAAAYWLARTGYDVTVLEQAPALRAGGQNIDVRTTGREVLRRMGLEDAVRARNTGEVGTRFVDETGGTVSEFGVDLSEGSEGPTAELEILRGALAEVIVEACPDTVAWRFGDRVASVEQTESGVRVGFDSAADSAATSAAASTDTETFDLLVVAEGVGSRTRRLVFGEEPQEQALGMYAAYGTIPRAAADDDWWRVLVAPGSRQAALRPDDEGTIRANINFMVEEPVLAGMDDAEVRAALRERCADLGWEVPRILDGFDAADDLYVDWLRQVRCPTWHRGRVCLVGDAAWCVTPVGGGGASLALIGSYVLAAQLSTRDRDAPDGGYAAALAAWEEWLRPVVGDAQDLPRGVPRLAAPRSAAGVAALRWGTKVAASSLVRSVAQRVTSGPGGDKPLPDFVEA